VKKDLSEIESLHRPNVVAACSTQATRSNDLKEAFRNAETKKPILASETAEVYIRLAK
jgi:hypothetical protein